MLTENVINRLQHIAKQNYFASPSVGAAGCAAVDVVVVVAELPARGAVWRSDRQAPLRCGDVVAGAELAALKFAPAAVDRDAFSRWSGLLVYAPQNCGRVPIAPPSDIFSSAPDGARVIVVDAPANGSVCLDNEGAALAEGEAITIEQLRRLIFVPRANAAGRISVMRYTIPDLETVTDVLLVVGPDASSIGVRAAGAGVDDYALSSFAVALLLDLTLSGWSAPAAKASSDDALPVKSVSPVGLAFDLTVASELNGSVLATRPVSPSGQLISLPRENLAVVKPDIASPPSDALMPLGSSSGLLSAATIASTTTPISASSAPVIAAWSPDTGVVGDGVTGSNVLTLYGTATANNIINIFDGMTQIGTAAADSAGAWIYTTATLKDARHVLTATATDGSGQTSAASTAVSVTVDTLAPPPPVITSDTILNANQVLVAGTAEAKSTITIYDGTLAVGTSLTSANGLWSVTTSPLSAGAHELTATATDAAGNVSALSAPFDPVTGTPNAIVLENEKAGTPLSVWWVDPGQDSTVLQGYTTQMGTNVGGTVQFKIDNETDNADYTISIYRLGYYGGDGARLITTIDHTGSSAVVQPAPLTDASTGLVDAGNWSVTDSWSVPTDAVSGVYVANVTQGDQVFQIPFIISDSSSSSAIIFQTADETWQAYNGWGGNNVYGGQGPGYQGAAYAVSYNRPIITRDGASLANVGEYGDSNDMLFSAEFPTIYWLEENGYDVSYISGAQLATAPNDSLLLNHQVYMDSGHDEYWSDQQYLNVQAAGEAGVNLMFLSGNEVYWQTRFTSSIDATADPDRTMVTYKDTHANALIDPTGTATSSFMDARFASTGGLAGTPSNSLTGQLFSVDANRFDTITIPYGQSQLRIWRDTSIADTAVGQTASLTPGLLGYEWDSSPDNGFMPAGLVDLSSTTLQVQSLLLDYGNATGFGTATHNLVEFRDPVSGALVFSTGTVFWSWGLSDIHDVYYGTLEPVDPSVQQATVNVLADMGVQPQTLQASLVLATASTDATPPTSAITNVSTYSPTEGQSVTVTGTATDVGGVIGGVEVSADGGKTWHPATSNVGAATETWSYTFTAGATGSYTLESRAVDDSINLEAPSDGVTYSVLPSSNLTIFGSATPSSALFVQDPNVEIGFKFTTATEGVITGIRFYKDAQNTGTHIGDLWSSNGTLLAGATFTGETSSGWQQVNFSKPVLIQPGATYYASYYTTSGYSYTDFYFDNVGAGVTTGSLTALGGGLNGVYAYSSSSAFPATVSFANSDNYWVDVVFSDANIPPQANDDSGFTTLENTALTINASQLLANDTDPNGLTPYITGVSNPTNGTVSYNSSTQVVTFTPTTGYIGLATFSYTITDADGGTASASVSLRVNSATPTESLFNASATPATVTVNDPHAVELGVKFTASANGEINGIRFYKGASNTGTHIADLWTSTGTLLATATFTNETSSGWQEVDFSTPISITAGVTYIASYHTNVGEYSVTANYFTSDVVSGNLTAPASGNGVYGYGSGSLFPNSSYAASNYLVDVVYTSSSAPQPPVANADSGFVAVENTALTINASQLLANDTDPNGLTPYITGVSNPANGTVNYNSSTRLVTFTPTTGYTGAASFTYTITDADGGTSSANVALTVKAPVVTQTLFSASATPATVNVSDTNAVELGVKFTADANGQITGIRFYKGPSNTGTHIADLWTSTGTLLASATFTSETASGWQEVDFAAPVSITAGTTYVASYHTNVGEYSSTANYFTSSVVSGDLTAPASGNGVYAYGSSDVFPTNSYNSTNYWVDVVYAKSTGVQAPVANADSGFVATENTALTINASQLLANDTDPNGLTPYITGVSNPTSGTVTYNSSTQVVTFTPTTNYTGSASFTYAITDADGGTASANVALTVISSTPTYSLFSSTYTPADVNVNDPSPVDLGVKFQASENGEITGIRFYKGPSNTGTHVADLWTSTGTLLASATFTNETASGWQEADFSTPVNITAGTTYVASYYTSSGDYSADPNSFVTSLTNGPLTAPSSASSGGNGVYAYGSSNLFPTNSYNSTSYAVDVVFKAQLAA